MRIIRVFPRYIKNATPTDELAYVGTQLDEMMKTVMGVKN